ncbi:hypothetical protein BsWGS_22603 [Bradybaena similaris]
MLLQAFLLFVAVHASGGELCRQVNLLPWEYCEWGCCHGHYSSCCSKPIYRRTVLIAPVATSSLVALCFLIILIVVCVRRRQRTAIENAAPSFQPQVYTVTTA